MEIPQDPKPNTLNLNSKPEAKKPCLQMIEDHYLPNETIPPPPPSPPLLANSEKCGNSGTLKS